MEEVIKTVESFSPAKLQEAATSIRQSIDHFSIAPAFMYLRAILKYVSVNNTDLLRQRDDIIKQIDHAYSISCGDSRVNTIPVNDGTDEDGAPYGPPGKKAIHIWMVILAADSPEPTFYYHPKYEDDIARIQANLYVGFYKVWNYYESIRILSNENALSRLIKMGISPNLQSFMDIQKKVLAIWPEIKLPDLISSISCIPVVGSKGERLVAICQYA